MKVEAEMKACTAIETFTLGLCAVLWVLLTSLVAGFIARLVWLMLTGGWIVAERLIHRLGAL